MNHIRNHRALEVVEVNIRQLRGLKHILCSFSQPVERMKRHVEQTMTRLFPLAVRLAHSTLRAAFVRLILCFVFVVYLEARTKVLRHPEADSRKSRKHIPGSAGASRRAAFA